MNTIKALKAIFQGQIPPPGLIPEKTLNVLASLSSARKSFSKLTNIERLITTLCHKEPDHVPCTPMVFAASRRLTGISYVDFSLNPEAAADALLVAFEFFGGEMVAPPLDLSIEASDFGQKTIYPENSTPHPDYKDPLIKDVSDYRKLKRIDLKDAKRMQNLVNTSRIMVENMGFRGVVSGFVFGPLGILGMMRGAEHLFRDCVNYHSEVMAALDIITEVLIEYAEAQCDTGILGVTIDTLYASCGGLTKDLWEKIEGPFAREIANAIRRKKCTVAVHNCGDGVYFDSMIRFMAPNLISFAQLPDDCKSPKELKEKYGEKVVLAGYIQTPVLSYGTPYDVIEACKRQINDLADGGGFVLAPGCEFPPNAPLENALAISKAAEMHG